MAGKPLARDGITVGAPFHEERDDRIDEESMFTKLFFGDPEPHADQDSNVEFVVNIRRGIGSRR